MGQYKLDDTEFGTIIISTRRGMKSIRSNVRNGAIELHVPTSIRYDELCKVIDDNRTKLRQMLAKSEETKLRYHEGQEVNCLGGYTINICRQQRFPGKATFGSDTGNTLSVKIHTGMDFGDERVTSLISQCLKLLAKRIAASVLPRFAENIATEIGTKPAKFVIGGGLRKLGHCTAKGEIQLSCNLVFLPKHLAKFIILHELAHLTHFNHSPQFHNLLNQYCNGNEKILDSELKHFRWPVKL